MDFQALIFQIAQALPGLLFAITIHEFAHGYVAKKFGDDTAERAGRLTMNPIDHIDPIGTVVFPLVCVALGWGVFGWAKPVPVNSRNFSDFKKGLFWVSFAGPLSNIMMAIISAFALALIYTKMGPTLFTIKKGMFVQIVNYSLIINVVLAAFNLLPFPGFDGSKMLASRLSYNALRKYEELSQYLIYIFYGLMILSFAGVHILGRIFQPFFIMSEYLVNFFVTILS